MKKNRFKLKSNKYGILLSNTAIFAVGNILVKLISFILMPLYTTALTTAEYGVSELINSTTEIIIPIVTLCIIEALYRFSIDENADFKSLFANSFKILLIGDILLIVICLVLTYVYPNKYIVYFCGLYISTTFYKLVTQFARGLGHVKRYAFYGVLNSFLLLICTIIFVFKLKGGVSAYINSFAISYGITGAIAFFMSKEFEYFSLKKGNPNQLKEMLRYSIPNIPNMISWWVNSISDRYILMLFSNVSVVGLYTASSKLPAMINLISSIFQQAWQYSAAKEIKSEDSKDFFSMVLRAYMYICACSCSILILFNKILCKFLLQSEFYISWKYVPLLLLAAIFGCISTYFGTFYQALKKNSMLMVSTLIGAIINIILNFTLIPLFSAYGAAIATVLSYFIVTIIRVVDINKKIELDIMWYRFFLQIFIITVMVLFEIIVKTEWAYCVNFVCFICIIFSDMKLLSKLLNVFKFRKNS